MNERNESASASSGHLLVLTPTDIERKQLAQHSGDSIAIELCGFGPIAAGVETARLLAQRLETDGDIQQVVLLGIAGTFDSNRLPVSSACSFRQVNCYGIGVAGDPILPPSQIQIPQTTIDGNPVFEQLELKPASTGLVVDGLLTVMTASDSAATASQRRQSNPGSLAEDMEAFAVALAAAKFGLPLTVIRGISNVVGDRDHANWQIGPALRAAMDLFRNAF